MKRSRQIGCFVFLLLGVSGYNRMPISNRCIVAFARIQETRPNTLGRSLVMVMLGSVSDGG